MFEFGISVRGRLLGGLNIVPELGCSLLLAPSAAILLVASSTYSLVSSYVGMT